MKSKRKKNPSGKAKKYYVVDQEQRGLWCQVAHFYFKKQSIDYAKFLSAKSNRRVRVKRTFPGKDHKPL